MRVRLLLSTAVGGSGGSSPGSPLHSVTVAKQLVGTDADPSLQGGVCGCVWGVWGGGFIMLIIGVNRCSYIVYMVFIYVYRY